MNALKISAGPELRKILDKVLYWQAENQKSNADDLLEELKKNGDFFKI